MAVRTSSERYRWAATGDVNAFFGLMLDNIANLLMMVSILVGVFGFPEDFILRYMIPGTAIGVLTGDLIYSWLAWRLAARTGRNDITAMPLGIDTPSTLGMIFFVLGQAYTEALKNNPSDTHAAAMHAWHIGIWSIAVSGAFKLCCSLGSVAIHKSLPRAGLLGSLAAVAAVLIGFLPLLDVLHAPVVGFISLAIILTTLVAKVRTPFGLPGSLASLLVGGVIFWIMQLIPTGDPAQSAAWEVTRQQWAQAGRGLLPVEWLTAFQFHWLDSFSDSIRYWPIVIPFALGTVIGGINCTESASSAGDDYHAGEVVAVEAVATLAAALSGGVLQTTPYIGHPAYKAMGGRAAYTIATALFVGLLGVTGLFSYLYLIVPKATVFPIMVFVGLEITAQSFAATPRRHYTAVALALIPALAALATIMLRKFGVGGSLPDHLQQDWLILTMLYNGFFLTSLLWSTALAHLIDHRLKLAATFFAVTAVATLFGVIHSPLESGALNWPWALRAIDPRLEREVWQWTLAYGGMAMLLWLWGHWLPASGEPNLAYAESPVPPPAGPSPG
jgi:AGZA family xanthine/uracil permease-like MFS transporter